MVYDPVRDRVVQSPLEASGSEQESWRKSATPVDDRYGRETEPRSYPPSFQHEHSPPGTYPVSRSTSGGLRGLLHDDDRAIRPGSGNGRVSSGTFEDQGSFGHHQSQAAGYHAVPPSQGRASIHGLLNSTPLAPPISHSSSASSHRTSSPSNNSPATGTRHRQDNASMVPVTPLSANPRFQSPYASVSPASAYIPLPPDTQFAVPDHLPGPSRRSLTMDPYGHRSTPHTVMYRSPSTSESPRGLPQPLPYSRPTSSSSQSFSHPSSLHGQHDSPHRTARILSEDFNQPRGPGPNRRETMPAIPVTSYSPSRPAMSEPPRSPSPLRTAPYDPYRFGEPTTVSLQPITSEEVAHLRLLAVENNPLRRKKRKPLPSWSGPSPSSRVPSETDISYFPPQSGELRRSTSRLSITPGPGYPPASDGAPTPTERNGKSQSLKRSASDMAQEHDTSRRKVSDSHYVGNAAQVADHYNARPDVGVQNRELSPIIGLKKFNNWIKSVLVGLFTHRPRGGPGAKVLDIGCGKGGDLQKWKQARIQLYVGMDIAATSIDQARDRFNRLNRPGFDAFFFAHDCYSQSIKDALPGYLANKDMYDNVSMQFCMHYAFESASKARMMIENVSRYLRPGGKFIGTVPDSELLLDRLKAIPEDEDLRFGNGCYSVQFEERRHKGLYGHAYHFYLEDAVDDVPEYIVDWENFVSLASEYRLKLIYKKSFHEILQEEKDSRDFGPLLGKMGVINPEDGSSQMDGDQWEAANLYMAFAFEKS
ncbi:mRNA capping enzyme-domain-containing protein [Kockovaella imperatae]|uniref:mRNA cap guanine-N(7) methyltransferase n=1 Tax=Kockovaella imperatae TaxID=4999 RepID=A0A1Y1U6K0_9TREE|nr:mRNA capping enzyme-domain-containing protein [Kockovaella imperatae]ORX33622.1 mRNA capping enzyme-domain-containing protein [Kockovaella imperatae]